MSLGVGGGGDEVMVKFVIMVTTDIPGCTFRTSPRVNQRDHGQLPEGDRRKHPEVPKVVNLLALLHRSCLRRKLYVIVILVHSCRQECPYTFNSYFSPFGGDQNWEGDLPRIQRRRSQLAWSHLAGGLCPAARWSNPIFSLTCLDFQCLKPRQSSMRTQLVREPMWRCMTSIRTSSPGSPSMTRRTSSSQRPPSTNSGYFCCFIQAQNEH